MFFQSSLFGKRNEDRKRFYDIGVFEKGENRTNFFTVEFFFSTDCFLPDRI
ncbi:hypothetical protein LEP1GSC163_2619 [Leptospira santarosai str. CBC379]|nr:hypothetical protein LEP1GSC163_2619 [Leptospira santarosai str. CBC379]